MSKIPMVSIIVACKNVAPYIGACLASGLSQSVSDLEILVIDDGSTDGTSDIIRLVAHEDERVRLFIGSGFGPAAARNIGLEHARGDWIAILDGDDLFHKERLSRLLEIAATSHSDIVTDGLMAFTEVDGIRKAWPFFAADMLTPHQVVDIARLFAVSENGLESPLGYLKPLIKRAFLLDSSIRYNADLFIGEDFDFLARALAEGAKMTVTPEPMYFYRRHIKSISHRLSASDASNMLLAAEAFAEKYGSALSLSNRRLVNLRLKRLKLQRDTQRVIFALKERSIIQALRICLKSPASASRTSNFFIEGRIRRFNALLEKWRQTQSQFQSVAPMWSDAKLENAAMYPSEAIEGINAACQIYAESLGKKHLTESLPFEPYWRGFVRVSPTVVTSYAPG